MRAFVAAGWVDVSVTRRSWLVRAGTLCVATLGACAARDEHRLRLWAMGREGQVVAELLQGFTQERPDIAVRVDQLPWSAAHEKLLTAFAGDATPDIAQLGNTWLAEFVALGALQALQPAVVPQADYFPGIWATNVVGGQLFGVPWYVDTRLLFYRRDLLQQAGHAAPATTWSAWVRQMQDIVQLGPTAAGTRRHALLLPLNEYDPLVALAMQHGEPLLRDGGRYGNFRSAAFVQTLDFVLGLYRSGLAPAATNNQVANLWQEFARGSFSFYITGPWNIGEFRRRLPTELQGAWATAPLPAPDAVAAAAAAPGAPGSSLAGGSSLAVFARSKKKPEALALIEYLSRPLVQQRFHALTGNLPPRRSAWWSPALANDAPTQAFARQLEHVRPVPQVPEWERIATELRIVLEQVVHGKLDAAQMPALLDARADQMLEKRRWMLQRAAAAATAAVPAQRGAQA